MIPIGFRSPGSTGRKGMAERDGSTEHVGLFGRQIQLLLHREPLSRKRLKLGWPSGYPKAGQLTSLISIMSMSPIVFPTFFNASWIEATGPIPMISGSHALHAYAAIRARGFTLYCLIAASLITTLAAAPSQMPEAFPAVTTPVSLTNTEGTRAIGESSAVEGAHRLQGIAAGLSLAAR
jgi:hypothetical protein